jgi:hypothetical protein
VRPPVADGEASTARYFPTQIPKYQIAGGLGREGTTSMTMAGTRGNTHLPIASITNELEEGETRALVSGVLITNL